MFHWITELVSQGRFLLELILWRPWMSVSNAMVIPPVDIYNKCVKLNVNLKWKGTIIKASTFGGKMVAYLLPRSFCSVLSVESDLYGKTGWHRAVEEITQMLTSNYINVYKRIVIPRCCRCFSENLVKAYESRLKPWEVSVVQMLGGR